MLTLGYSMLMLAEAGLFSTGLGRLKGGSRRLQQAGRQKGGARRLQEAHRKASRAFLAVGSLAQPQGEDSGRRLVHCCQSSVTGSFSSVQFSVFSFQFSVSVSGQSLAVQINEDGMSVRQ